MIKQSSKILITFIIVLLTIIMINNLFKGNWHDMRNYLVMSFFIKKKIVKFDSLSVFQYIVPYKYHINLT